MKLDISIFLAAVAIVESDTKDDAVGRSGELSRYQISPLVWNHYSDRHHSPTNQEHAELVARRFIDQELAPRVEQAKLETEELEVTLLASMWNWGPKAADRYYERPPSVVHFAGDVATEYQRIKSSATPFVVTSYVSDEVIDTRKERTGPARITIYNDHTLVISKADATPSPTSDAP